MKSTRPSLPMTGGCQCGVIRYEITSFSVAAQQLQLHGLPAPQTISLRAGTLDDTSWLVPVAHFFTRSAQPWLQPASGA